ncbi:26346_t:CDS:2, partial [Dentiscutata erythropus]
HNIVIQEPEQQKPHHNEDNGLRVNDYRIYTSNNELYSIVQRFHQLSVVDQTSPQIDESNHESNNTQMVPGDHNYNIDNTPLIQEQNLSEFPNTEPNNSNDNKVADLIDISENPSITMSSNESGLL